MNHLRDRLYGAPTGPRPRRGELRPVVYLPTWVQWDVMRQRPQYILEALASAGHEVYFVDPSAEGPHDPAERVHVLTSLKETPSSDVIVYTHFAPARTMLDRYEDPVVIYDILDDLSIYDADEVGLPVERTVRYHHRPLMESADFVVASNETLVERHRGERSDIILVENGVDPTTFRPDGPRQSLGVGPVVGYHGAIAAWFDFSLMEGVAISRPDYDFVLVGPVLEGAASALERLLERSNVTHYPQAPAGVVASYVRSFDAGIIPFVVNEMTEGVTPLKMYEYLATGVPVVATPLPACVSHPDVSTASSVEATAVALDSAVAAGKSERARLREEGLAASWDTRLEPLIEALEKSELRRVP